MRFGAHGGRGDGVGLIATEEVVARLLSSRLTFGLEGRARARCREEGGSEGAALAKAFCPTRRAGGTFKAEMAGGGSDVQMADAAGAAGSGANGVGSPAGRAGSEASVGSGSRQDRSSADNGRDMHGGGLAADYPDGAEDQGAELPLIEGAGPSPFRRKYCCLPNFGRSRRCQEG